MLHTPHFITHVGTDDSGGGGYTPPATNLIGDWNPISSKILNSSGSSGITNGGAISKLTDSSSSAYEMTQTSSGAMPIWYESDSGRNNKPYIRFNETRSLSSGGITFLEMQNQFAYDAGQMTYYIVMDYNHWDSIYDGFTDVWTNADDDNWDGGFRLGSDSSSYSMYCCVTRWPQNDIAIKSSMSSCRVVIHKFYTGTTTTSLQDHQGGYTTGTTIDWSTDSSRDDFGDSRQSLSGYNKPLLGTGRDGYGDAPYGGIDFNFYRLLVYDTFHDNATSLTIANALKNEYSTL